VFDFFGVAVLPQPNADVNSDGAVDAADNVIWRKNNGQTVPPGTLGDADGNGRVNDDDYQVWRAQFGTSPPAERGAAPTSAVDPLDTEMKMARSLPTSASAAGRLKVVRHSDPHAHIIFHQQMHRLAVFTPNDQPYHWVRGTLPPSAPFSRACASVKPIDTDSPENRDKCLTSGKNRRHDADGPTSSLGPLDASAATFAATLIQFWEAANET
jgi:hypothetical protein